MLNSRSSSSSSRSPGHLRCDRMMSRHPCRACSLSSGSSAPSDTMRRCLTASLPPSRSWNPLGGGGTGGASFGGRAGDFLGRDLGGRGGGGTRFLISPTMRGGGRPESSSSSASSSSSSFLRAAVASGAAFSNSGRWPLPLRTPMVIFMAASLRKDTHCTRVMDDTGLPSMLRIWSPGCSSPQGTAARAAGESGATL